jgi:hypothetical protein
MITPHLARNWRDEAALPSHAFPSFLHLTSHFLAGSSDVNFVSGANGEFIVAVPSIRGNPCSESSVCSAVVNPLLSNLITSFLES